MQQMTEIKTVQDERDRIAIAYERMQKERAANDQVANDLSIGLLNAERLELQLNQYKGNKRPTGRVEQYRELLKTCTFKIWVLFHVDKFGRPFTDQDRKAKKHRQYIPSLDLKREGGAIVTDLEYSYNELCIYLVQRAYRIDKAKIFLNDHKAKKETVLVDFKSTDPANSKYADVYFREPEYNGTKLGGKIIDHISGDLGIFDMINFYE